MATKYTDLATVQEAAKLSTAARAISNEKLDGGLHRARARITFTGSIASGDIIKIAELPTGAVVLPHLCVAKTGGVTAAVDIDIGTPTVADAFSNGLSMGTAAGIKTFNQGATALGAQALTPVPFTAPTYVQALVNANAATVAAEYVEFEIVYALKA